MISTELISSDTLKNLCVKNGHLALSFVCEDDMLIALIAY